MKRCPLQCTCKSQFIFDFYLLDGPIGRNILYYHSFPLLLDEIYIVICLLLDPHPLDPLFLSFLGELLSPIDILLLNLYVSPQSLQLVLVSLLFHVLLGIQGIYYQLFLIRLHILSLKTKISALAASSKDGVSESSLLLVYIAL